MGQLVRTGQPILSNKTWDTLRIIIAAILMLISGSLYADNYRFISGLVLGVVFLGVILADNLQVVIESTLDSRFRVLDYVYNSY